MKVLRWALINGLIASLAIAGFGYGVAGAAACAVFIVWVYAIAAMLLLVVPLEKRTSPIKLPVPMWLDGLFDAIFLGILVWTGHWFLGIMYLIATLSVHHFNSTVVPLEPSV